MVDSCFSVGAFCLVGALIAVILKQYCSEHSMAVTIAVCAGVMTFFVLLFDDTAAEIRDVFEMAGDLGVDGRLNSCEQPPLPS